MRRAIGIKVGARDAERRIETAQLGHHQPADLQAALGSRDKEKAGAIGVANADIFNRRRLTRRKIGGAGARGWRPFADFDELLCQSSTRPDTVPESTERPDEFQSTYLSATPWAAQHTRFSRGGFSVYPLLS
jgi:hypothetical protein